MKLLVIGGSDAGIMAALRARELDPSTEVTMMMADAYPNLSICGLPYALSGEVPDWQALRHRTIEEIAATGLTMVPDTTAKSIDVAQHTVTAIDANGEEQVFAYDKLVVGTGARPKAGKIANVDRDDVFELHSMATFFRLQTAIAQRHAQHVAIVGAGYIGIEMAETFVRLGIEVALYQRGPEVLSTVDPDMGYTVHELLTSHGVAVHTNVAITDTEDLFNAGHDLVLVVTGVQPNSEILATAGAAVDDKGRVIVDDMMQTNLPDIYAAGDLIQTKHVLLGQTYLPLGTTAHKQGRIAGENALGASRHFKGIVGSQVIRLFDKVIARTGILETEASAAGFAPFANTIIVDDHKAYIPGATKLKIKIIGDRQTHRLLGAQVIGEYGSEVAKRSDLYATAIQQGMTVEEFSDYDLSYSPPIAAPWDAVQQATQAWETALRNSTL